MNHQNQNEFRLKELCESTNIDNLKKIIDSINLIQTDITKRISDVHPKEDQIKSVKVGKNNCTSCRKCIFK